MTNLLDIFLHWNPRSDKDGILATADVIIAHEFGDQKNPSSTTTDFVLSAARMAKELHKPLICQSPGDRVAKGAGIAPVLTVQATPDKYLDTDEVNRQMTQVCKRNGWKRVALFTHPHHAWRLAQNLKTHGLIPLYPDLSGITYDASCPRVVLSTPWLFVPREILVRLYYLMTKRI